ncbi:DEAD/DEAH box helicase, partial [candidate division KSB1 bacterium]|nr:DEAD/DEAH box helicase [candidate division KSB1 bacterium]
MSSPYHAKYFAHELSRHYQAGSVAKLSQTLFDACIDLNPHQIDAALFAMASPLSRGAMLADEVGLGKTIEAGLLLCQYWAERRRRLLVICPASLRKQWSIELQDKFNLPNIVMDAKIYDQFLSGGEANPLDRHSIVILSIHFAARHSAKLRTIPWHLVVIDEAHKLRNVYRSKNKMAREIKWALDDRKKVLLTATPLQNSLMELYGLSTFIDEQIFGTADAFRTQFLGKNQNLSELSNRLSSFIKRTLRNQVTEYVRYTQRRSKTVTYEPTPPEQNLYERISSFLQNEESYSIPYAQRHLMTLILRKLLASSAYAIAGTLRIMRNRLLDVKKGLRKTPQSLLDDIYSHHELVEDYAEEYSSFAQGPEKIDIDPQKLDEEIFLLDNLIEEADSIPVETKAKSLLKALDVGFSELEQMGANRKVVLFTESRRTQDYLFNYLSQNGYNGRIVLFNGTNNSGTAQTIYEKWMENNRSSGHVSGSRGVDIRNALIEHFRDHATILIATEAAAEGINLQFCSFLINYDLPWNPQRIEQRIGRCHRYGQKFDVVVLNFVNQKNHADCRVFELLNEKFNLFAGVFGASDEILGAIESGVDFENRILEIYQSCRSQEEIDAAFDTLQEEMETSIHTQMEKTRQLLLEHFDRDVHTRFKAQLDKTREQLDRYETYFWELSKFILGDIAQFDDADLEFDLYRAPLDSIQTGRYRLISKHKDQPTGQLTYRLTHPLGEFVVAAGRSQAVRPAHIYFDITNHPHKISCIQALMGQSGWMAADFVQIESFDREDYILMTGVTDGGKTLDQEICENFFYCRAAVSPISEIPPAVQFKLKETLGEKAEETRKKSIDLNTGYFSTECDKIDHWAEDMIAAVESKLFDIRQQIKSV